MIVTEIIKNGELIKHTSDRGVLLEQVETGVRYAEVIDINPCPYNYVETDEPDEDMTADEALEILTGGGGV